MKNFHFVLSRYKEKACLETLKKKIQNQAGLNSKIEIFIYDKFEIHNDTWKLVENVGRENYSWFFHVLDTWDNPPDYYGFIHPCGENPEERPEKFKAFMDMSSDIPTIVLEEKHYGPLESNFLVGNNWNPKFTYKKFWRGNTKENIPDVEKQKYICTNYDSILSWWKDITNASIPKNRTWGGMCITSNEAVKSWGKEFWQKIFEQIVAGGENGEISHFLERSMYRIAQGNF